MNNEDVLISVGVISFNQERYIGKCLDSILMQELDFKYEVIIGDDCSTDSTQTILKEYQRRYPDRIRLVFNQENRGISENYKNVLSRCKGKYIALCEGDDYWTSTQKLRIQVSFLESHEEYGFVGTYNLIHKPDGSLHNDAYCHIGMPEMENKWECYGNVFSYAKYGPVTRTVSLCFRQSIIKPFIHISGIGNDIVLQTILASASLFAKYSESLCVYRQGGVSTDYSLEKQLYYNDWTVKNRLLQKRLFPKECDWDETELADSKTYLLLKNSVLNYRPLQAKKYKELLMSDLYKNKVYSRYFHGPISCLFLTVVSRITPQKR